MVSCVVVKNYQYKYILYTLVHWMSFFLFWLIFKLCLFFTVVIPVAVILILVKFVQHLFNGFWYSKYSTYYYFEASIIYMHTKIILVYLFAVIKALLKTSGPVSKRGLHNYWHCLKKVFIPTNWVFINPDPQVVFLIYTV